MTLNPAASNSLAVSNKAAKNFLYLLRNGMRLKTLGASICPLFIAASAAIHIGTFHVQAFLAVLSAALLIQIGTNLANDYYDFLRGADTLKRIGPLRIACVDNLLQIKRLFWIIWGLALVPGFYLTFRAGPAIAWIGIISIACGWLYTAGPFALAYNGLGEIFVFIFFGPVAVIGTFFVQSFRIDFALLSGGLACGFLSSSMLAIANWRDYEEDKTTHKNTLCVQFGITFAKIEISFFYIAAFVSFSIFNFYFSSSTWTYLAVVFLAVFSFFILQSVWKAQVAHERALLLRPAALLLWFLGLLFFVLNLL